ncbi:hypothetical protein PUV47_04650 [Pseudovibrio exalbescens]|uniref:DUF6665 family protein n=1 Tax=Pseudovibrio exalbescens TaxID=197461 RepID=UPI0023668E4E|nr:DUF6665 family protein [Pseudovibrio exalbescens]MDD7909196.1 hypothetical protein [Pseudovibrio exalbescens]
MFVRPPQAFRNKAESDPISEALHQEVMEEKVGTLSRLNKKLEAAVDRLTRLEIEELPEEDRQRLVHEAGEALWHVVIQRELVGLTGLKAFLDHMGVPKEVRLKTGPMPAHLKRPNNKP